MLAPLHTVRCCITLIKVVKRPNANLQETLLQALVSGKLAAGVQGGDIFF